MKNSPSISVCVPTYNRYRDLEKLIISFMLQEYKNSELLILDDLGSDKIKPLVNKYQKKDSRIKYHKNKKNLGFSNNLMQCFNITKCDYIVFMGDDDLFIDTTALNQFIYAFSLKNVGVVKARQILFKNSQINQAYPIAAEDKDIVVYKNGEDTFENLWFESLSISGLAFINDAFVKKSTSLNATLYPQVELMGKVCLKYNSAAINHYLVAVKSHTGQLNCMVYHLEGVKTNMLDDWLNIYKRIKKQDKNNTLNNFTTHRFLQKFTVFMTVFFPYTTLTQGRVETLLISANILRKFTPILLSPIFFISFFASILLPSWVLSSLAEKIKKSQLYGMMNNQEIKRFNKILSLYYR